MGYGDTGLENNYERIFAALIMVTGVILQTVANGSVISMGDQLGNSGDYEDNLYILNKSKKEYEIEH